MKKYFKKFVSVLPANFFVFFTLLFFSPLEVFMGNIVEFDFSFQNTAIILFVLSLATVAVFSLIESLFPKKAVRIINVLMVAGGIMCFVQPMFLNGEMRSLTGEQAEYSLSTVLINGAIWVFVPVLLLVIFFIAKKHKKAKPYRHVLSYISIALIVIELVGSLSVALQLPEENPQKDLFLTNEKEFTLAKDNNVVYFIIDTCDGRVIDETLSGYPDLFDNLDGFTYYPDATSTHSRTYPSITYLLTKQKCYFDVPYSQYVHQAHTDGTFLKDVKKTGADLRIFTSNAYIDSCCEETIDNYGQIDSKSLDSVNVLTFIKKMVKISLYRVSPYAIKPRFQYTGAEVNTATAKSDPAISEDDLSFASVLLSGGLSLDENTEKAFRFYHLYGTHSGCSLGADCGMTPEIGNTTEAMRGCIKIIEEYVSEMKRLGVFENSTIIVTADHGFSGSDGNLEVNGAPTPIMLIKPAGESNSPFKISSAPVCHDDLFATVISALGGDSEKYGRTVFDYAEGEVRERYHYFSSLYSDEDGEVALREYKITGNARDISSWSLTGNNWDINYSERAVSKHRLSEILN